MDREMREKSRERLATDARGQKIEEGKQREKEQDTLRI